MDKRDLKNRIDYVVACISIFAERFNLSMQQAYSYLRRFKGIEMLLKHFGVMHTLSIEDSVDDMLLVCQNNGGKLS